MRLLCLIGAHLCTASMTHIHVKHIHIKLPIVVAKARGSRHRVPASLPVDTAAINQELLEQCAAVSPCVFQSLSNLLLIDDACRTADFHISMIRNLSVYAQLFPEERVDGKIKDAKQKYLKALDSVAPRFPVTTVRKELHQRFRKIKIDAAHEKSITQLARATVDFMRYVTEQGKNLSDDYYHKWRIDCERLSSPVLHQTVMALWKICRRWQVSHFSVHSRWIAAFLSSAEARLKLFSKDPQRNARSIAANSASIGAVVLMQFHHMRAYMSTVLFLVAMRVLVMKMRAQRPGFDVSQTAIGYSLSILEEHQRDYDSEWKALHYKIKQANTLQAESEATRELSKVESAYFELILELDYALC